MHVDNGGPRSILLGGGWQSGEEEKQNEKDNISLHGMTSGFQLLAIGPNEPHAAKVYRASAPLGG
jgi:hypothetical protein